MKWINSLRPFCGIITSLLVISGFNLVKEPVNWNVIMAIFLITSTAMLWNDLYDRKIDLGKGKTLANQYPKIFFLYGLLFTALSLIFSIIVLYQDIYSGVLCLSLLAMSIIYNYIQNIPVIKNLSISISTGSILLLPMFKSGNNTFLWVLIIAVFIIITVREYLKDVEDMEVDRGQKKTLALLMDSKISKVNVDLWKSMLTTSLIIVILISFLG